jgi:hypothetical protein
MKPLLYIKECTDGADKVTHQDPEVVEVLGVNNRG